MCRLTIAVAFVYCLLLSLVAGAKPAAEPLRIVVPNPAVGGSDRATRIIAEALRSQLGMTVIVENRSGAGGRLAAQQVKASPPGDNVLIVGNPSVNIFAPIVFRNPGYDPHADFVPVSHFRNYEYGVAVGPAVPLREVKHLLAWLRANPDQANVGVPALGSLPHFFALKLAEVAQVKLQMIPYRGSAPLLIELSAGQLPVAADIVDSLLPLHQAGKLRILAIGGEHRARELPDVPTLKEAGIDVEGGGWSVFFAPASMPADKVQRLGSAIQQVMRSPQVINEFQAANMTPVSASPAQTARMLNRYRAKWEPIVRASGFVE